MLKHLQASVRSSEAEEATPTDAELAQFQDDLETALTEVVEIEAGRRKAKTWRELRAALRLCHYPNRK